MQKGVFLHFMGIVGYLDRKLKSNMSLWCLRWILVVVSESKWFL